MKFHVLACACIFLLTACNDSKEDKAQVKSDSTERPSFDLSKVRAEIDSIDAKFSEAFRNGDSAAMANCYTADALLMPPNSMSVKKEDIASAWGAAIRMGLKELKLSDEDVTGNETILSETGSYEIVADKNQVVDKGKFVVVWKQENGQWKIFRDIWNTSMPASK